MIRHAPLVSIVTPSYNQGQFIEDTLLSVKNQDYPSIEHIVVDGGSTDNTLEILRKYESQYNLRWISEPDEGQSDAVNKGFRIAKGELIGWLNSDDCYFSKDVISYVVSKFEGLRNVDMIYGDAIIIDENNLILRHKYSNPWFHSYLRLLFCFINQPSAFFRRQVVERYKLDVNIDLPMDYEYWLRLVKNGLKFKHVNKILSAARIHSAAKTTCRGKEMRIERRKVQERYGQKLGVRYYLLKPFGLAFLLLMRILGTRILVQLFLNSRNQDLAFPATYDSALKAVSRQLFYLFRL